MITQEYLKSWLRYEPEIGEFFWVRKPTTNVKIGAKAGSINAAGYLQIQLEGKIYLGHTLAWLYIKGEWTRVDHEDLDRGNIKFVNLRKCTQSQNVANSCKRSSNTSGFKGVSFNKRLAKFQASIKVDYVKRHLGYFDLAEEAAAAYAKAAKAHFGEFARTI